MPTCALNSAVLIATLAAAAAQDVRRRLVDDWTWLGGVAAGLPALAYSLWKCGLPQNLGQQVAAGAILAVILVASWRLRLMGEADILAYASVELIHPVGPGYLPPSFSTFLYSKALLLFAPPVQLAVNLVRVARDPSLLEGFDEPVWRILLALALLTPRPGLGAVPAEELRPGVRRFRLSRVLAPVEAKEPEGGPCRWYVPAYPLLPLIAAGYLVYLVAGDPLALVAGAL